MTHTELVNIGAEWLTKKAPNTYLKCQYAVKEFSYAGRESPDVFGIRSGKTVLIEVKVSRSDFFADKRKVFRKNSFLGIGQQRYYLTPIGLIKPSEIGEWGLLECSESGKIKITKQSEYFEAHRNNEMDLMYSILRRLSKPCILFEAPPHPQRELRVTVCITGVNNATS